MGNRAILAVLAISGKIHLITLKLNIMTYEQLVTKALLKPE